MIFNSITADPDRATILTIPTFAFLVQDCPTHMRECFDTSIQYVGGIGKRRVESYFYLKCFQLRVNKCIFYINAWVIITLCYHSITLNDNWRPSIFNSVLKTHNILLLHAVTQIQGFAANSSSKTVVINLTILVLNGDSAQKKVRQCHKLERTHHQRICGGKK